MTPRPLKPDELRQEAWFWHQLAVIAHTHMMAMAAAGYPTSVLEAAQNAANRALWLAQELERKAARCEVAARLP